MDQYQLEVVLIKELHLASDLAKRIESYCVRKAFELPFEPGKVTYTKEETAAAVYNMRNKVLATIKEAMERGIPPEDVLGI